MASYQHIDGELDTNHLRIPTLFLGHGRHRSNKNVSMKTHQWILLILIPALGLGFWALFKPRDTDGKSIPSQAEGTESFVTKPRIRQDPGPDREGNQLGSRQLSFDMLREKLESLSGNPSEEEVERLAIEVSALWNDPVQFGMLLEFTAGNSKYSRLIVKLQDKVLDMLRDEKTRHQASDALYKLFMRQGDSDPSDLGRYMFEGKQRGFLLPVASRHMLDLTEEERGLFLNFMESNNRPLKSEILFKYNALIAKSDPDQALASTLEEMLKYEIFERGPLQACPVSNIMSSLEINQDYPFDDLLAQINDFVASGGRLKRDQAILNLYSKWAGRDFDSALQSLMESGTATDSSVMSVFRGGLAYKEPDWIKTQTMIEKVPEGEMRETAKYAAVSNWALPHPESARKMASQILDPAKRKEQLQWIDMVQEDKAKRSESESP
jgi:hypothetical protein